MEPADFERDFNGRSSQHANEFIRPGVFDAWAKSTN
jgi:hypothetical protein